jgi:PAS domain S-box-containing protein
MKADSLYFKYLDDMDEIALIEEADSTIKYANKAFYNCFGLKPKDVIGKKLLDFIVPEDRASCDMEYVVTPENPAYRISGRSKRYDGKIIWLQYVGKGIFDDSGELSGFHELALDITDMKEKISDNIKQLERANKRIQDLSDTNGKIDSARDNQSASKVALYNFSDIVSINPKIEMLITQAKAVSGRDTIILIEGESGTGKEMFAHSIHNYSDRANGPFVAINCGAIPSELIGSELFGYVEGAFTGASMKGKRGKFEQASWGTLFLDEIGDMPMSQQAALLRVLETKAVTRIGGNEDIPVNVRVICATNKNLKDEVAKGNFREDLYYRISVINLKIPPLRCRKEDILELTRGFINDIKEPRFDKSMFYGKQVVKLMKYDWPGNVRELRNVIERIVFIPGYDIDELFEKQDHPEGIKDPSAYSSNDEKEIIIRRLLDCNGNVSEVARIMGISRKTLYKKMDKYSIDRTGV